MFIRPLEDIDYLVELVDRASKAIMAIYDSKQEIHFKHDQSPVTQADLVADKILCEGLISRWPDAWILSEESSSMSQRCAEALFWAIDPLDGTKEFIKKNGEFTVNVALIEDGQPILGVVAAPAKNTLYIGWVGHYAKKRVQGVWQTMTMSWSEPNWEDTEQKLRVATSRSHPSIELDEWLKTYPNHQASTFGSSLKICAVAEGLVDCYPRLGRTCYWDIAAGHAILKSVGGNIWQWPIQSRIPLRYDHVNSPFNEFFIATGMYRE